MTITTTSTGVAIDATRAELVAMRWGLKCEGQNESSRDEQLFERMLSEVERHLDYEWEEMPHSEDVEAREGLTKPRVVISSLASWDD